MLNMYRMYSFSKPFESIDHKNKVLNKTSHSFSFHDREEIRRRLAVDSDGEDIFGCNRIPRKSSLASRLQTGQSLQICFMNENVNDISNQGNDDLNKDDNTRNIYSKLINDNNLIDNSQCSTSSNAEFSPNNNSCIQSLHSSNKFEESLMDNNTNRINSKCERPSHLFTKLGFGPNSSIETLKVFSTIPKPTEKEQFQNYHAILHDEARFALAQVKEIVKRQMEVEQQKTMKRSPIYSLIKLPFKYQFRKNKISKSILMNLSVSQLQIIVNDLFSQVEALNEELVQLLVERDESHMEQDSILVDIEDLTIFLISKQ